MAAHITTSCDECGWTGGPYRTAGQAAYALRRHSCDKHRADLARAARVQARKTASGPEGTCDCPRVRHHHGDRVMYIQHKCRCRICRDAQAAYARSLGKTHAYGRHDYIPGDTVRTHLRTLSAAGMGWKTVAHTAGIAESTVYPILYGKHPNNPTHPEHRPPRIKVRGDIARALLAVTPQPLPGTRTDSTGTARRLQALVTIGWSASELARRLHIDPTNIAPVLHGTRTVTRATATKVTALYDELWSTPGPSTRARNTAAKNGWAPPLAWDDDTIDDPHATPHHDAPEPPRRRRTTARIPDLDELHHITTGTRYTLHGLAARLRVNPQYLERHLYSVDRDLLATLRTNTADAA